MTTSLRKQILELMPEIEWKPVSEYKDGFPYFVLVCNEEKQWVRFGRKYAGLNRWYYSAHTNHASYTQGFDDVPTHWAYMVKTPWEIEEYKNMENVL